MRSYDDCTTAGHKDGTPEFPACVLDRKTRLTGSSQPEGGVGSESNLPSKQQTSKLSYSSSNFEERRLKEEYVRAQLGLSPGRASFGQCVTQLDVALWSVNNPS